MNTGRAEFWKQVEAGQVERIDRACFVQGNEDEWIVEFWWLSGSIVRTCYDKRTTATAFRFEDAGTWEFDALERMRNVHN